MAAWSHGNANMSIRVAKGKSEYSVEGGGPGGSAQSSPVGASGASGSERQCPTKTSGALALRFYE